MPQYVNPGAAFSGGLEDALMQRAQAEHQRLVDEIAIRRQQQDEKDAMELSHFRQEQLKEIVHNRQITSEDRRAGQAEKAQKDFEALREKTGARYEKRYNAGDYALPEDLKENEALGGGLLPGVQEPDTPQPFQGPLAPDQALPEVGTGPGQIAAKPGGFRLMGTAQQRTQSTQRTQLDALMGQLSTSEPESPEFKRAAMQYEMLSGKAIPAGLIKNAPMGSFEDYLGRSAKEQGVSPQSLGPAQIEAARKKYQQADDKPPSVQTITIQTVDDNGNKVTRVVPKADAVGKDFKAPNSATAEARLMSAQAVTQSGEDIVRQLTDPKFQAVVGPAMGRASTLRDFIGNPPPEFAQLAGEIESYALANMGVHGMRSAQGAQMIIKLLDQHHTPASLIATVHGLNNFASHFMENSGKKTQTTGGTKDAPTTGTVRKYNPATGRIE